MLCPPRVADPRPTCTVVEAVSVLHSTPYSSSVRPPRRAKLNAVKTDLSVHIAHLLRTGGRPTLPRLYAPISQKKTPNRNVGGA